MKKLYAVLLLACSMLAKAQSVPPALDTILSRTLDSMRAVVKIKSLSAAVQLSDASAWAGATGISSLNPTVNVTPGDAYLIGSVTKTITSACILQLVDEGKLSLDDSLYKLLDTFQYVNPNITIRQLLRHQSGLNDVLANPACQPTLLNRMDSVWSEENLIRSFLMPPLAAPGGSWNYCNTNYMLLSLVIKRVTGQPFYQEIRRRFFTPLKMNTIAIPSHEALSTPVAHVWMDLDGDKVTEDGNDFYTNWMSLNSTAGACGGYFATARDVSRWMRTYMRGDLLSAATMAEARTTVFASGAQGGLYGLGLMKNNMAGYLAYGHGGDLAYSASSWYFPAKDISISVLGNDADRNSWQLLPVVEALLKAYNQWQAAADVHGFRTDNVFVTAYPSPFENRLTVAVRGTSARNVSAELVNVTGQCILPGVAGKKTSDEILIEWSGLSELPSGVYCVNVYADGHLLRTLRVNR